MNKAGATGWFVTFSKPNTTSEFVRFRWWDELERRKHSAYLGTLGTQTNHPTQLLDAIVSKVMRLDATTETAEQQDRHLEMLLRLRDTNKNWEAWEQRWNGG